MKNWTGIIIFLLVLTNSTASFSQSDNDGNWIKIAEKLVSFKSDEDVVTPAGQEKK